MPPVSKRFTDRVAIISGASSGIGLATAKRIGSEGGRIILVDVHQDRLVSAAHEVKVVGAPETLVKPCDVSEENQVVDAVTEAIERFGRLDIVVNNAGMSIFKSLPEHTQEDWLGVLGVNLLGAFYFIKQSFRFMRPGGAIVNVSSIHAEKTSPFLGSYAAAKAGLLSLTRTAALEGKRLGIRVNAVMPGAVDTPMLWNNPNVKSGVEHIDPSDVGQPEEIASAIAYLASDDASFVQGESLRVDGGRLSQL